MNQRCTRPATSVALWRNDSQEVRVLGVQMSLVDGVVRVSTKDAMAAARSVALTEGLLVRHSSRFVSSALTHARC